MKKNIQQRLRLFAALAVALVFALVFTACDGGGSSGSGGGSDGPARVTYSGVDGNGDSYKLTIGSDVAAQALYTAKANDKYVLEVTKSGSIYKSTGIVVSVEGGIKLQPSNPAETAVKIIIAINNTAILSITIEGGTSVTLTKDGGGDTTLANVPDMSGGGGSSITVPRIPIRVQAEGSNGGLGGIDGVDPNIYISWDPITDATGYKVYYAASASGPFNLMGGTITQVPYQSSYKDTSCAPGQTRYYKVSAVNGAGESAKSATVSATMPADGPLPAPTEVTATAQSTTGIRIDWNLVGGINPPATMYRVYYDSSASGPFTNSFEDRPWSPYTDNTCSPGQTRYYKVSLVNSAGESAKSAAVSATTIPSGGGGTIKIANSSTDPGDTIDQFYVYNSTWAVIGDTKYKDIFSGSNYILTDVPPGQYMVWMQSYSAQSAFDTIETIGESVNGGFFQLTAGKTVTVTFTGKGLSVVSN